MNIKNKILTLIIVFTSAIAQSAFAQNLADILFQNSVIQGRVQVLEKAGWKIEDYEAVELHSNWTGMGRNSKITLLNVHVVGGSMYMQTNNIVAVFSAGSSGVFHFKKFLNPWALAHSESW